jgi:hypothetical protein
MIYQGYYLPEQRLSCWDREPYVPWDMTANNPVVAEYVPELVDPVCQSHACEYGGLLAVVRAGKDDSGFIGHTSWRQKDKAQRTFDSANEIRSWLGTYRAIAWGGANLWHERGGKYGGLANQSERHHPGIVDFVERIASLFPDVLGPGDLSFFKTTNEVFFYSYWAMGTGDVHRYFKWSVPLFSWMVINHRTDPFLTSQPRAWSFVQERLFSIWLNKVGLYCRPV